MCANDLREIEMRNDAEILLISRLNHRTLNSNKVHWYVRSARLHPTNHPPLLRLFLSLSFSKLPSILLLLLMMCALCAVQRGIS